MAEIIGTAKGPLDEKRMYLPGLVLKDTCPNCKSPLVEDFGKSCLSYPEVNTLFTYGLYCQECDHEWDISLFLKITLEVV